MKNNKFSIIVPAYNVENYVGKCLDSIISQSYENYEIILINDGSTDNTYNICCKYAEKNSKIKLINKENGGLSDARNTGLELVKGDYAIFIDSDDYIDIHALNNLNNSLKNNPDVVITRLVESYEECECIEMDKDMVRRLDKTPSKKDAIKWIFNESENTWPAQKYIISSRLIKNKNIRFKVGFLHEDIDWTTNVFYHADTFSIMCSDWYYLRVGRQGSITTTSNFKRALDVIKIVDSHIKDPRYNKIDIEIKNIIFNRLAKSMYITLRQYKNADNNGKREIERCLKNHRYLLKYTPNLKFKLFSISANVIGEKKALDIMSMFK